MDIEERGLAHQSGVTWDQALQTPPFGAHGEEETPVLIPNTEVKLFSGDYTATSGKLARRRIIQIPLRIGGVLFSSGLYDPRPDFQCRLC